ncbi:MAG: SGNH/GDSL hydrolase family protein [Deltaproteobacteria bacterium]|nr:SGNH/GDSL hydrolase family protein [Deltaproteobacteria bacterium]
MTTGERPAQRWMSVLLAAFRGAAAAWAGYAALSLVVRVVMAAVRLQQAGQRLRLVLLNSTTLLGISAILLLWLLRPEAGWSRPQRRWLLGLALAPPAVALAIGGMGCKPLAHMGILAPYLHADTGRPGFAPNHCYREQRGRAAAVTLCTCRHGGRPTASAGQGPSETWLLLGDSFVFGSGVADDQTLAQHTARILAEQAPGTTWRVVNGGFPGLSFGSYVKMLQSQLRTEKPSTVVIGFNAGNDLDPADTWERLDQLGERGMVLSAVLGVEGDLYPLEQADEARWRDEAQIPEPIRRQFAAQLQQLLTLQREHGFRLVIWSYYGPVHLFDAALSPQVRVAWPAQQGWGSDARLHIVGDGHPTAEANRLFAQQIVALAQNRP